MKHNAHFLAQSWIRMSCLPFRIYTESIRAVYSMLHQKLWADTNICLEIMSTEYANKNNFLLLF